MKLSLETVIFVNRAPFNDLHMVFNVNNIILLTSINGTGKTTILSYIVDAFYSLAASTFDNLSDKQNIYYRISSMFDVINKDKPSFVYLRFKTVDGFIDYIDIKNNCSPSQYNNAINLENKISFHSLQDYLNSNNHVRKIGLNFRKSKNIDSKNIINDISKNIFNGNILTYFPSYRYELPLYLNDQYKNDLQFTKKSISINHLINPIETISNLDILSNWFMDVLMDLQLYKGPYENYLFQNLNDIITQILSSKNKGKLRFGIGPRRTGLARIQILQHKDGTNEETPCPSIFSLSAGEASMLSIFGELIRQADNNQWNLPLSDINGIVLVDEIEKNTHIKLQKEIIPSLLSLFPNIQFILTSHSPFLTIGLSEHTKDRTMIVDVEKGIPIHLEYDSQYKESCEIILKNADKNHQIYNLMLNHINKTKKIQIVTEGKNTEHIKKAIGLLDSTLLKNIHIVTGIESKSGDEQLKTAFLFLENLEHYNKFLFVWDCDAKRITDSLTETKNLHTFCFSKNSENKIAQKGIENIYAESYFSDDIYDYKEIKIDYGGEKKEKIFNKNKFLEKIKKEHNPDCFKNYNELINKIISIINHA